MNPLLLLLGLFSVGSFGFASSSTSSSSAGPSARVDDPVLVDDPTTGSDDTDDDDSDTTPSASDSSTPPADSDSGSTDETPVPVTLTLVIYDDTGAIAAQVENGADIDFGETDVSDFQVGAEIDGDGMGSVVFEVGGATFTQHLAPYDMPARAIDLTDSAQTVTVTAYSGTNGTGDVLGTEVAAFTTSAAVDSDDDTDADDGVTVVEDDDTVDVVDSDDTDDSVDDAPVDNGSDDDDDDEPVVDSGSGDPADEPATDDNDTDQTPATVSISLVTYGDNNAVTGEITDGDALDFGMADVSNMQIGAEIDGDGVESVVFEVGGETYVQHIAPYDMPASAVDLTDGTHTVTVTAYSDTKGTGDVLGTETFTFETTAMVMDDTDDDDMPMDHGDHGDDDTPTTVGGGVDDPAVAPTPDGTPIVLVLGQSNAGLFDRSNALEEQLAQLGSDAQVVGVYDGGASSAQADGEWNIVTGDGTNSPGRLYTELLQTMDDVRADTPDAYIAGAVWLQGEADRSDKYDYYGAVKTLFTAMHDDLGETFPITIVGLSDYQGTNDAGRQHVQDAQMQLAEDLSYVTLVDADEVIADAGLSESEAMRDDLHFNPEFFDAAASAVLQQPALLDALGFDDNSTTIGGGVDNPAIVGDDDMPMDHGDHGDDDDDMSMDHDHAIDDDHSMPAIDPPGVGASQSEINAYLKALGNLEETHSHGNDASMADEHMAAMELAPRDEATHVAIGDGDWSDPDIWSGGEVPGDNAKVLIPDGVTVTYEEVSDARLFTVRVDGKLDFATDEDSQMIFDTMIVSPDGHLEIGTPDDPVDPDVNVDLIIANNGKIDTNWDPMLLSRGIVSHGKTSIHGAEKDSHDKVVDDPMKGDTSVKFASVPDGWEVGDTIVIAGTHYEGWAGDRERYSEPEDEVRVITKIDSNGRVHFDEPLIHDHDAPRDDLTTSVANYTRNVSVETEDADSAEIYERGHVMFMHSDEVDVRFAEFSELGRTDKSEVSQSVSDINNVKFDSNVQGRYSLHIHRAGTEDLADPAILEGNAVFGSPGWGVVHHDSNAVLTNNATYDTFGAGFVAETGNETGLWEDNIAIYAKGTHWGIPKNTVDVQDNFDTAKGGEGFWFQGRMVEAVDNVAASVNIGFAYFHRDKTDTTIDFDAELFDFPDALDYDDNVTPDDVPILVFDGNETFAAHEGLHVVKSNTAQGHDIWSKLTDFTAWSVVTGAHLQYTSHYIVEDFDVVGKDDGGFRDAKTGILLGNNLSDIVIVDAAIDGFDVGIDLNKHFTNDSFSEDQHDYFIIDADMKNVGTEYVNYDKSLDTITTSNALPGNAPELELKTMTYKGSMIEITGEKTDGLGTVDFPNGMDAFQLRNEGVDNFLSKGGYWSTSDGKDYFLMKVYFTDRATSEVYYETHPVYLQGIKLTGYTHNGEQDIVTKGGVTKAGDTILDEPFEAEATSGFALAYLNGTPASSTKSWVADADADSDHASHMAMIADMALVDGADQMDDDDSDAHSMMMMASADYDMDSEKTLAVFSAAANTDFGISDDVIDDFSEFYAGTLDEDGPAVQTDMIDLNSNTMIIDLAGLTAAEGTAFTLMEADEISGIFEDAVIGGLGTRDANILIDYEADSVSLTLTDGTGAISVSTVGDDGSDGAGDALWTALTADQPVLSDTDMAHDDDDHEDMLMSA